MQLEDAIAHAILSDLEDAHACRLLGSAMLSRVDAAEHRLGGRGLKHVRCMFRISLDILHIHIPSRCSLLQFCFACLAALVRRATPYLAFPPSPPNLLSLARIPWRLGHELT